MSHRRRHVFARSKQTVAAQRRMDRWAHDRGLDGHDRADRWTCSGRGCVTWVLKRCYSTERLESLVHSVNPLMRLIGIRPGEGGWKGSVIPGGSIQDRRRRGMLLHWQERAAARGEWGYSPKDIVTPVETPMPWPA